MFHVSLSELRGLALFAAISLLLYMFTKSIWNRYFHPLSRFPGPPLASVTSLWYFRSVRNGIGENHQLALHRKYGNIVRIAPDMLSISDAEAVDTVYGPHGDKTFTKTEFYDGLASHISPRRDVFSERDESKAAERRRMVASIYSQSAILEYEPAMDDVTVHLEARMNVFAKSGEVFDISGWFHRYGFDVIGALFFGRKGGFGNVKDGADYNGWCRCMETMPNIGGSSTYMPWMIRPFWMVSEVLFGGKDARDGVSGLSKVIVDAKKAADERSKTMSADEKDHNQDILSKLIAMARSQGTKAGFGTPDAATEVWTSIWAGGDTTGTTLTAAMYYLHKNPGTLARLVEELETAQLRLPIQYSSAVKLPYLNAVMQEAMRLHPVIGIGLPRRVPPGGARVSGEWIPGGSTIVMNSNVVHQDKRVFGDDAELFRPERWLQDPKQVAYMSRHIIAFGYGRRICLGRHIARTEMWKALPTLLLQFQFELEEPEREWKVNRGFFQGQKEVNVRVRRR